MLVNTAFTSRVKKLSCDRELYKLIKNMLKQKHNKSTNSDPIINLAAIWLLNVKVYYRPPEGRTEPQLCYVRPYRTTQKKLRNCIQCTVHYVLPVCHHSTREPSSQSIVGSSEDVTSPLLRVLLLAKS